jgi:hypothetical protein
VSQTTAVLCAGDDRVKGCGERIAVVDRGTLCALKGADILSFDRLGRARIVCTCGAVTMTRGQTAVTR